MCVMHAGTIRFFHYVWLLMVVVAWAFLVAGSSTPSHRVVPSSASSPWRMLPCAPVWSISQRRKVSRCLTRCGCVSLVCRFLQKWVQCLCLTSSPATELRDVAETVWWRSAQSHHHDAEHRCFLRQGCQPRRCCGNVGCTLGGGGLGGGGGGGGGFFFGVRGGGGGGVGWV